MEPGEILLRHRVESQEKGLSETEWQINAMREYKAQGKMTDDKIVLQNFLDRLNQEPAKTEIDRTPDGKAVTLPISFVEMTLDEIFLGQWGTRNYTTHVVLNEVVGSLELWVLHPITQREITRIGAASIIIQVDKTPEGLVGIQRNEWALNPSNKKANALDLGYPKLKAECVKNAAQSLGKVFGRDLNRKKADVLQVAYKELTDIGFKSLLQRAEQGDTRAVLLAKSNFSLTPLQLELLEGTNGHAKQIGQ